MNTENKTAPTVFQDVKSFQEEPTPGQLIPAGITQQDVKTIVSNFISDKFGMKVINMKSTNPADNVLPSLSTDPVKRKAFEETKKLVDNFREKVLNYPKRISYEGSMVLCVLLSMTESAKVHISGLPAIDQETIKKVLPPKFINDANYFNVSFDKDKDFKLDFFVSNGPNPDDGEIFVLNMINAVAHPQRDDLKNEGEQVFIEDNGDKIAVGGKIVINKKTMQKIVGFEPKKETISSEEEPLSRRQPVAGRNAFELRTDLIAMALDFLMYKKS